MTTAEPPSGVSDPVLSVSERLSGRNPKGCETF